MNSSITLFSPLSGTATGTVSVMTPPDHQQIA
jgi:hypothetical protein